MPYRSYKRRAYRAIRRPYKARKLFRRTYRGSARRIGGRTRYEWFYIRPGVLFNIVLTYTTDTEEYSSGEGSQEEDIEEDSPVPSQGE